jgi:hypothetical protein
LFTSVRDGSAQDGIVVTPKVISGRIRGGARFLMRTIVSGCFD